MLVLIIGYVLTVLFSIFSVLCLIGAFRQTRVSGIGRALLLLYMFVMFGFLALFAALLAGI